MSPVLLHLFLLAIRGRIVRSIRLLRRPKYLVGFVIGAAYLGFWSTRFLADLDVDSSFFGDRGGGLTGELGPMVQLVLAAGLMAYLTVVWLLPWGRLGLPLKEAELLMLLPAPVRRRDVIHYALLKGQGGIVFGAVLLAFLAGGGALSHRVRLLIGVWALFTLLDLNKKGRALFVLRQREIDPARALRRRLAIVAAAVLAWSVLAVSIHREVAPAVREAASARAVVADAVAAFAEAASHGVAAGILLPFRALTAPVLADGWLAFARGLAVVLAAIVLAHELVVRSRARFEEAALQHARDRELRTSRAWRYMKLAGRLRRHHPFELSPVGRPEVAVVWKNLHALSRTPIRRLAAAVAAGMVLIAVVPAVTGAPGFVFGLAAGIGVVLGTFVPVPVTLALRNDFHADLGHLDLVRTWPLAPHRLAAAEILGPAMVGTACGALGGGLFLAALAGSRLRGVLHADAESTGGLLPSSGAEILGVPALPAVVLLVLGLLPVMAGGTTLVSSIRNLGVLAFPGWLGGGQDRSRGVAALGQRLLLGSALLLALVVGLIPAAAAVGVVVLAQWLVGLPWSAWAFPLWGLAGAGPLLAEAAVLVRIAGMMWSRLDPSGEILESRG